VYVTARDLEKSFIFKKTVKINGHVCFMIYSSLFTEMVERKIITQKTIKSERKIEANNL